MAPRRHHSISLIRESARIPEATGTLPATANPHP